MHNPTSLLTTFLFATVALMGAVHLVALKLSLYYKYLWLDLPMHVLGGITVSLGYFLLPRFKIALPERYFKLFPTLIFVLAVGLLWEWFEIWAGIPLYTEGFAIDMLGDLAMDLVGGTVGYLLARSLIRIS